MTENVQNITEIDPSMSFYEMLCASNLKANKSYNENSDKKIGFYLEHILMKVFLGVMFLFCGFFKIIEYIGKAFSFVFNDLKAGLYLFFCGTYLMLVNFVLVSMMYVKKFHDIKVDLNRIFNIISQLNLVLICGLGLICLIWYALSLSYSNKKISHSWIIKLIIVMGLNLYAVVPLAKFLFKCIN